MDRRNFILTSIVVGSGLYIPSKDADAIYLGLLRYVAKFAAAVGAGVVASDVYSHAKNKGDSSLSAKIKDTNRIMSDGGYTDLSSSNVYEENSSDTIMYPALTNNRNDVCVPFIRNRDKGVSALLEGPSIIALAESASEVQKYGGKNVGSEVARKMFQPVSLVSNGSARFNRRGKQTEHFTTDLGDVKIRYNGEKDGTGMVNITARKKTNNGWKEIFDSEYDTKMYFA